MNEWGGPFRRYFRAYILEDIVVFTSVIIGALCYDHFYICLFRMGLVLQPRPVDVGLGQIVVIFAFSIMLARKISQYRFHA